MPNGRFLARVTVAFAVVVFCVAAYAQQYAEPNVNMVSGQSFPGGDPFLRQQNEPSFAISTRNPLHLLAGANDYRAVDIPFNAPPRPDEEETGDAWLGYFVSTDGGNRWFSTLLDGYPQQTSSTSPLKGFQAGADPVVRAGANGMFYYAGIVLNRGDNPLSGAFVARFIDNNNLESGNPIAYLDTKLIAKGSAGQFVDKPWILVTPANNGTQCTVSGQTFPAQNIYLAYTILVGGDVNIRTKIYIAKSGDCGATWGAPTKISESYSINQGVALGVDPTNSNNVYVIWRQFKDANDADAILFAKSTNAGGTFSKGTVVTTITPFEQKTSATSIRSNAYPAFAVDDAGRLHVAWSERDANGDGRIVLITSTDGGSTWPSKRQVDASTDRGHQFMPAMTFAAGKLTIVWYDLRLDHTIGTYTKSTMHPGFYDETPLAVGNLAPSGGFYDPNAVFWNFLADQTPPTALKLVRRHTLDVRLAEFDPAAPIQSGSVRASRYRFGTAIWTTVSDKPILHDLQINPPNLPMFRQGTVPFFGDYIDVQAYQNAPVDSTSTAPPARVRHVVWTDNRDVRAPLGQPPAGPDWTKYTPVGSGGQSTFDPTQNRPDCTTDALDNAQFAASRNQNIYTTRVTDGLFAGAPGNAKPLGKIQRAFAVFVQNARKDVAYYRLTIPAQPAGGSASFLQFSSSPLTELDVAIPPRSVATRTVFVTNAVYAKVDVNVIEISDGGTELTDGLASTIAINPDPANPDIGTPDIGTPDIGTTEVFNPDIGTPDIGTPDIGTPDIGTPDIGTPDIGTPDIGTPDIGTPDIGTPDIGTPDIGTPDYSNPDIGTPDIGSSDIQNGSATDTIWTATNSGNTTGGFTVRLLQTADFPAGVKSQLILYKIYDTPVARGCTLSVEHNRQVMASIVNPTLSTLQQILDLDNSGITDSSVKNPTMWLAPKDTGKIAIRLVDPNHHGLVLDASQYVSPVVIAQSVNTADAAVGNRTPAISLTLTTTSLPDAVVGAHYDAALSAIGGRAPLTWTATGLPAGLTVTGSGITGSPQVAGTYSLNISVTSANPPSMKSRSFQLRVFDPLSFTTKTLPAGTVGTAYNAILTAAGGLPPRTFSIDTGALPPGLSLAADGTISGTPTSAGDSPVTFRVTDSAVPPQSTTIAFTIRVVSPSMFVDFVVQPTATNPGTAINPAPVVRVRDATGAVIPGAQVTLTLGANPGNEVFTPQVAITDATGLARFPLVVLNNLASNYTLLATVSAAGFVNASATSQPFGITSAIPATAAAGLGQLVAIPIPPNSGYPGGAMVATFVQGNTSARGFVFPSASSLDYAFVRLPFPGDNIDNGSLAPGQALIRITWSGGSLPDVPINVSTTPGKAVARFAAELVAPPGAADTCGSGFVSDAPAGNPIDTITPGQGIGVAAFGIDTENAVLVFAQGTTTIEVPALCALSSGAYGVVGTFAVPKSLSAGTAQVSIRTSVNGVSGPASDPVQFNVVAPIGYRCIGAAFELFNNWNGLAVDNGGLSPSFIVADQRHNTGQYCLDSIGDYHYNLGNGTTTVGTIGLLIGGFTYGPWAAAGSAGQGGVPNANWTATPPTQVVVPNGTYRVNDSDPTTWSQNSASGGYGFSKVIVREAVPVVTFTVQGRLKYNGADRVPTTPPNLFLRNETTGQQQPAKISWAADSSTFTISDLPAGTYGVEVSSQEQATGLFYPGGFYSWTTFDAATASGSGIDVNLTRLIHLTVPDDNAQTQPAFACPPSIVHTPVSTLSWDPIDIPGVTYNYTISTYSCPFNVLTTIRSGSTTSTSVLFDPLPPNNTGESYVLNLYAYSGQLLVGQIMVVATAGLGWDLRFQVTPAGLSFNVTPASTSFSMSGTPVAINGTITNGTTTSQTVFLQSYIDQGIKSIGAGGEPDIIVPALTTVTVPAGNTANASLTGGAGMTTGSATLRIDLMQGSKSLQELSFPITLVP